MAKGPINVPPGKPMKFVRGTWPPQPKPLYAQTEKTMQIKPQAAKTRDYSKNPPLGGDTGMSGLS